MLRSLVMLGLVALAGCGRVGFERQDAADSGDASPDGALLDTGLDTAMDATTDAGAPALRFTAVATPAINPEMFISQGVQAIAASGDGFCATGVFAGDIVIDSMMQTAVGGDDAWMGCFDGELRLSWLRAAGTRGSDHSGSVAVGPDGDVYFRGLVEGGADFGGGTERRFGADDWFVARYGPTGTFVDAQVYGGAGDDDFGGSVTVRGDGRVAIAGGCGDVVDFGGGPVAGAGERDGCLALVDGTDTHVASFSWGGAGRQFLTGATAIDANRFVATAIFSSPFDLGSTVLTPVGAEDMAVFVVDDSGTVERSWTIAGPGEQFGKDPTVDADGNIYVVGSSAGDTDFGDGLRTIPTTDAFIASYAPDGALRWVRLIGGSAAGPSFGDDILLGRDGLIYAVGSVHDGGGIDGTPASIVGERDAFILSLARDGTLSTERVFGSVEDDRMRGIALLASGELVIAGYLGGSVVLDDVAIDLPAPGVVLAKLSLE